MNILFSGVNGYLGSNIYNFLSKSHDISIVKRNYSIGSTIEEFDCFFYFSNPNEIDFNINSEKAMVDMVMHFHSLIKVLSRIKVKHIVYASTVRIYDNQVNNYANTHLFIENLLNAYVCKNELNLTIARFGNIFGGSVNSMIKRNSLVPHIFIKNALEKNHIKMLSDGFQYRDFTSMTLVNRYIEFIISEKPQIIDICTGTNIRIIDVIKIISKEFPTVNIEISNKNLNENIVQYNSTFNISKNEIVQEIINTIQKWKKYYDSNTK